MNKIVVISVDTLYIKIGIAGKNHHAVKFKNPDNNTLIIQNAFIKVFRDILHKLPKDSSITLVEETFCSMKNKKNFCDILLKELECRYINFFPSCLMSCFAAGIENGIVVEIEQDYAAYIPIANYRILDQHIVMSKLTLNTPSNKDEDLDPQNLSKFFAIDDANEDDFDTDELPMNLALHKIKRLIPVDLRKILAENIIVVGSAVKNKHFETQLKALLLSLNMRYVPSTGPWVGGSLYSDKLSDSITSCECLITYDDYCLSSLPTTIPDWFDKKFTS
ncbi:hypothetical protein TBLA_0E04320 [Henningerozyma blattae CBS 6284]|uniref:Uncharacterized protein n=1 Tax=Henningerozyma blattae (strain ATCC 34711 / CBS 6284 / DSM 70876 / NBRC 10599 / NRRL Y-10934 / UCD 77-7) TaxID=1071380 RepID=I2H534_HENB6|nr:hypothetical protein TBLA_0E04320 [Tetrapisispora blattae CBS 6284]CCH61486.1 hypothetical protein TBLA_0E04320 [Tetrapisispora blattae CBS 6284]